MSYLERTNVLCHQLPIVFVTECLCKLKTLFLGYYIFQPVDTMNLLYGALEAVEISQVFIFSHELRKYCYRVLAYIECL